MEISGMIAEKGSNLSPNKQLSDLSDMTLFYLLNICRILLSRFAFLITPVSLG
jgi:hypothetical protein